MDEVSRWVFTICCGAALCGVVSVLLPGKGMERLMRMVLGLFLLCCILPPGLEMDLSLPDPPEAAAGQQAAAEEVTGYFLQSAARQGEEELRRLAEKELREAGINGDDIQIYIEADTGSGLGDERPLELTVRLLLPPGLEGRADGLRERLEEELGVTVRLEYSGE